MEEASSVLDYSSCPAGCHVMGSIDAEGLIGGWNYRLNQKEEKAPAGSSETLY